MANFTGLRRSVAFLALMTLFVTSAFAGTGTLNYSPSGSSPMRMTTDGGGNNLNNFTLWDYSAGANGLGITPDHGALTEGAVGTPVTMQNAAVANGNGSTLTVTYYTTALVNVNCSVACSGGTTINFEGTDSTGTYFSIAAFPVTGLSAAVNSATTSGQFWIPVAGLTTIRARISGYSAGTITVTGTPVWGVNSALSQIVNATSLGAAAVSASNPVTPSNPPVGGANLGTVQVSVASTATQILAARTGVAGTGRICATIENTSTTAVYLGGSSVTTSNGMLLPGIVGASDTICTTAAIYGIVATGTETVSAQEVY